MSRVGRWRARGRSSRADLDAGEVAVVADADLGEAELVEGGFGLLDLGEALRG